jgi:hypothetical protein
VHTNTINTTSRYKRIPRTEVAYTNCLASSLNIFVDKTPVPSFGALFTYPSIDRKLYYNSSLSLNKSINLTSASLSLNPSRSLDKVVYAQTPESRLHGH